MTVNGLEGLQKAGTVHVQPQDALRVDGPCGIVVLASLFTGIFTPASLAGLVAPGTLALICGQV